ncbi:hypothetical protein FKM82_018357 [Ascaphus truei]
MSSLRSVGRSCAASSSIRDSERPCQKAAVSASSFHPVSAAMVRNLRAYRATEWLPWEMCNKEEAGVTLVQKTRHPLGSPP